jgi:hypothetical protein
MHTTDYEQLMDNAVTLSGLDLKSLEGIALRTAADVQSGKINNLTDVESLMKREGVKAGAKFCMEQIEFKNLLKKQLAIVGGVSVLMIAGGYFIGYKVGKGK